MSMDLCYQLMANGNMQVNKFNKLPLFYNYLLNYDLNNDKMI